MRLAQISTYKVANELISRGQKSPKGKAASIKTWLSLNAFYGRNNDSPMGLHLAAWAGNVKAVERYLEAGEDMEFQDFQGWTPLHLATWNSHSEIVKLLLHGSPSNMTSIQGPNDVTALHFARWNNARDVIQMFIDSDASLEAQEETALNQAVTSYNRNILNSLKQEDTSFGASDRSRNWRPIHFAAMNGHVAAIEALKIAGADLSALSKWIYEERPIHIAAEYGHVAAIKTLIDFGVDISSRNGFEAETPMHFAARRGHCNVIKYLASLGADVSDNKTYNSFTPMHSAAYSKSSEAIITLHELGASVSPESTRACMEWSYRSGNRNLEPVLNITPMHMAAKYGNPDTISTLKSLGADLSPKDSAGLMPIHWAARQGNEKAVKLLKELNVDISVKDHSGKTPLQWAETEYKAAEWNYERGNSQSRLSVVQF